MADGRIRRPRPAARDDRDRSCRGKRRYPSERAAEETAAHQRLESGDDSLQTYWCLYCTGWHIGHPPKRTPRL